MTDLIPKLKDAAERATPGVWQWWTSNSWRRLRSDLDQGRTKSVIEPYVARDGCPDLIVSQEDMAFIALASPANIKALIERVETDVPDDVARLVVAARIVAYEDQSPEALRALDEAAEAFASRVPWDGERGALDSQP